LAIKQGIQQRLDSPGTKVILELGDNDAEGPRQHTCADGATKHLLCGQLAEREQKNVTTKEKGKRRLVGDRIPKVLTSDEFMAIVQETKVAAVAEEVVKAKQSDDKKILTPVRAA